VTGASHFRKEWWSKPAGSRHTTDATHSPDRLQGFDQRLQFRLRVPLQHRDHLRPGGCCLPQPRRNRAGRG
jgi:hypothetical protein